MDRRDMTLLVIIALTKVTTCIYETKFSLMKSLNNAFRTLVNMIHIFNDPLNVLRHIIS